MGEPQRDNIDIEEPEKVFQRCDLCNEIATRFLNSPDEPDGPKFCEMHWYIFVEYKKKLLKDGKEDPWQN